MRWFIGQRGKSMRRAMFIPVGILAISVCWVSSSVQAATRTATEFSRQLAGADRAAFQAWYQGRVFFDAALDAYWAKVENKRRVRRAKRRRRQAFADRDYVSTSPPKYDGPGISKPLYRRWISFRYPKSGGKRPKSAALPGLDVYYASARRYFKFSPERIPEREFKRRFAQEALAVGLTKDQVVRVYALETGGRGTADMQAGINPITRKGRPISSALGYAQLLAANSVNVLSKHGPKFVKRLDRMVTQARDGAERQHLQAKLGVLKRMVRAAKSVPYKWSRHRAFARTSRGRALHVMNIDGLIGPWMQVTKLADLKRMAARKGRTQLSGAELELMNLAGPATGLEMMTRTGIDKPTSNFFSRRGYYRNTVVRGKDSAGLLDALERRMQAALRNPGSKQFLAVFDQLTGQASNVAVTTPIASEPQAFGFVPAPFRPRN